MYVSSSTNRFLNNSWKLSASVRYHSCSQKSQRTYLKLPKYTQHANFPSATPTSPRLKIANTVLGNLRLIFSRFALPTGLLANLFPSWFLISYLFVFKTNYNWTVPAVPRNGYLGYCHLVPKVPSASRLTRGVIKDLLSTIEMHISVQSCLLSSIVQFHIHSRCYNTRL